MVSLTTHKHRLPAIADLLPRFQLGPLARFNSTVDTHAASGDFSMRKTAGMTQAGHLKQLIELDIFPANFESYGHKTPLINSLESHLRPKAQRQET